MLGAMRSRSRGPSTPCPCGGSCRCHRPIEKMPLAMKIFFVLAIPTIIYCGYKLQTTPRPKRTIRVGEKTCEVRFVRTGQSCTSTGFCTDRGYDEAVCP